MTLAFGSMLVLALVVFVKGKFLSLGKVRNNPYVSAFRLPLVNVRQLNSCNSLLTSAWARISFCKLHRQLDPTSPANWHQCSNSLRIFSSNMDGAAVVLQDHKICCLNTNATGCSGRALAVLIGMWCIYRNTYNTCSFSRDWTVVSFRILFCLTGGIFNIFSL
jgi:hypothetical protein